MPVKIPDLILAIEALRITHLNLDEDCWYSCPKSGHCCDENKVDRCNCGADEHNAKIDSIIANLKYQSDPEPHLVKVAKLAASLPHSEEADQAVNVLLKRHDDGKSKLIIIETAIPLETAHKVLGDIISDFFDASIASISTQRIEEVQGAFNGIDALPPELRRVKN